MKAERQRSTHRNNAYTRIMNLERAVVDPYVLDPNPFVLTWEATVNGKKRAFVSYKSSTEGASLRYCHRAIDSFLRNSYVSSDASFAYKEGSSIQSCLNRHLHSDVFLKTDIHSFFTTIEKDRMEAKLKKILLRRYKKLCKMIVDCCY